MSLLALIGGERTGGVTFGSMDRLYLDEDDWLGATFNHPKQGEIKTYAYCFFPFFWVKVWEMSFIDWLCLGFYVDLREIECWTVCYLFSDKRWFKLLMAGTDDVKRTNACSLIGGDRVVLWKEIRREFDSCAALKIWAYTRTIGVSLHTHKNNNNWHINYYYCKNPMIACINY